MQSNLCSLSLVLEVKNRRVDLQWALRVPVLFSGGKEFGLPFLADFVWVRFAYFFASETSLIDGHCPQFLIVESYW